MLRQRVVSAIVLIPALIAVIWFSPFWLFTAIFGIVILFSVLEFYRMVAYSNRRPFIYAGLAGTAFFITGAYFGANYTGLALVLAIILVLIRMLLDTEIEKSFVNWVYTLAGMLYAGWMLSHFILLRNIDPIDLDNGRNWIFIALFATFATDTVAYFVGRALGRHKMAPSISPGKTWEGALGGFVGGLGAAILLAVILKVPVDWKLILLGCVIPVVAQFGDLVESMFKRGMGVKDAGRLIPGHGGILDRLDSVIFTVVVVYYYVRWVIG